MRAMVLRAPKRPLELVEMDPPRGGIEIDIECCAVCRTDLHVVDGELANPKLPLVPGHQIVGRTKDGARVGVPWLGWTCGTCAFCRSGRENLCPNARFTGYTIDGGYAERCAADERFCFPIPDHYTAEEAAPLLCAGLIGYRALRLAGDARRIGFYGFGSAAQILVQLANADGREVFAFTRDGDDAAQKFALEMGARWAGGSSQRAPAEQDAAIIFASAGALVPIALGGLARGGTVVCAGIHMSDIPSFPYELLWQERTVRSVANLTRRDGEEFLARAAKTKIKTKRTLFALTEANEALRKLRDGELVGTAVLTMGSHP